MPVKYLDPKTDLTFKKVFGEHENLVMSLLNALLPLDDDEVITHVEYATPEMLPETEKNKLSIVDVRCIDNYGRTFLVEMQLYYFKTFFDRVLYNACKSYSYQSVKGMSYSDLKPVYSLNIINDVVPQYKDDWRQDWFMTSKQDSSKIAKNICLTFIQLPNFSPETKGMKKLTELWLSFLTAINGDKEPNISAEMLENEEIAQALTILEKSAFTEDEMYYYDRYWDALAKERSALSDFFEKGKAEGERQKAVAVAKSLLDSGVSIDIIASSTGLTVDEIEKLM